MTTLTLLTSRLSLDPSSHVETDRPLDLCFTHERFGSRSSPSLDGKFHYLDKPLNETDTDNILQYCADYDNRSSNAISLMTVVARTSDRLHCEFVDLEFLQTHR